MSEVASTGQTEATGATSAVKNGAPAAGVGCAEAFATLTREHYRLVYSIAYQVVRNATDAEDVCQDAFLKAYRSRDTVRDQSVVVGWLARIARNAALDHVRGRGRRKRLHDEVTEQAEATGALVQTKEQVHEDERERLRDAVADLPEAEALVVTLRFLEGMTPAKIAERLGEKPTTVRVRLHRALKRLREVLGDRS